MSATMAATFAAVAREAEKAIEAARADDPAFNRKVDDFVASADGSALRVVVDLKPQMAFRVEVIRAIGVAIDALVVFEVTPSPRGAPPSTRAH